MGNVSSRTGVGYAVRLSPRAENQLRELSPMVSAVIQARLGKLAQRSREQVRAPRKDRNSLVQGHLLGRTFRALYEVDHDECQVTVLDVAPRG